MAQISKLKPGQVLYTLSRWPMGNTTVRTIEIHQCKVIEVHEKHVVASWNSNGPRKYFEGEVSEWKVNKPYVVYGWNGYQCRLAGRDEVKLARAEGRLKEKATCIEVMKKRD